MVVKTFALVKKKMSDGRQKRKRRTTLIKSKAALLPPSIALIKCCFFSESMMHFSHCPKNVPESILKRDFGIVLCLESADSNCTAVSKGKKIQNTKFRIECSTFFGQL